MKLKTRYSLVKSDLGSRDRVKKAPKQWSSRKVSFAKLKHRRMTPKASISALTQPMQQTSPFVESFRQASPYIVEHANSLFVIVIPGEVISRDDRFYQILSDLQLLHSLGIHLVVVVGIRHLLDDYLKKENTSSEFHGGMRVTDQEALNSAIHVASIVRRKTEGFFSRAPSVPLMRRHGTKGTSNMTAKIISGNFIAAKPIGIIDGVNFQSSGSVRFVLHESINEQLKDRNIVLLDNLGYSANGGVLNCNSYEIGLHAAVKLNADKLICLHPSDPQLAFLPNWTPLDTALDEIPAKVKSLILEKVPQDTTSRALTSDKLTWSFELLNRAGVPSAFSICILSCLSGVQRVHLVDANIDGALLSELYTRDGIGQMISTDFHEGIRPATSQDVVEIEELLRPIAASGVTIQRSYEDLLQDVGNFRVFEKERRILGCALVKILPTEDQPLAELAALCIHSDIRCQGKGDALLTYIEKELLRKGIEVLIILTTRTADWFVQRGFEAAGAAHESQLLPQIRSNTIDAQRNSQLYFKRLIMNDR